MKTKTIFTSILLMLVLAVPFAAAFEGSTATEIDAEVLAEIEIDPSVAEDLIPTQTETESRIVNWNRFLLWTHDGVNVMWGKAGNGYFRGEDNNDNSAWGIYGNHVFAGFYDNEFFYGKYRTNIWKARGLFVNGTTHGKFEVFPNRPDPQPVCRDSDGGFNVRKAGKAQSCIEVDGEKMCEDAKDYCVDNTTVLVEIYCAQDGTLAREKFECPFGCKNGACIRPRVCPDVYEPVCGTLKLNAGLDIDARHLKTYSNKCELVSAGAVFLYPGECKLPVLSAQIDAETDASLKTKAANVESENEANAQANTNVKETEVKNDLKSFLGLGI